MCVDAMWYGTLREGQVDLYLGFKGYSYEEVLVGAISSLMVFPINMILILIFRNCRLPKSRVSFFLLKVMCPCKYSNFAGGMAISREISCVH